MKLTGARIIDGIANETFAGTIEFDGQIKSVQKSSDDAASGDYTIMPGMVDAHTHLSLSGEIFDWWRNEEPTAAIVLRTFRNASYHLDAGETTVRDLGGIKDTVIQLRKSIKAGVIEGPRIYACGRWLNVTGGHGDIYGEPADGADGFARATRKLLHEGADVIKVMATAGALAEEGKNPNATQVSDDEMRAIAEICKEAGIPLAVHAHSASGMRLAIKHGATSIEHATWLEDDLIDGSIEANTALIPTLAICEVMASKARGGFEARGPEQASITDKMMEVKEPTLRKAILKGARIAAGTDSGAPGAAHGIVADEVRRLIELGMQPMDAIKAATAVAGDVVTGGLVGTLQAGKHSDIIIVRGNPLEDPLALKQVEAVILGGKVVRGQIPSALLASA